MCFMNKPKINSYTGKRLIFGSIPNYLKEIDFGEKIDCVKTKLIKLQPFLQKNYGKSGDCTLTSILTITKFYNPSLETQQVYDFIEKTAEKYLYNGETWGTFPMFNKAIIKETFKKFNINRSIKSKYFKNVGFNLETIVNLIDANIPIILSLTSDGRDYYKAHTITIVGYIVYKNIETNQQKILLQVYDNWFVSPSLIDYEALNPACEICY